MTWVNIADGDIDPESPITTGLMTSYRDNVPAQANGDAGSPLQQIAGGGTAASTASGARTNLGLGTLATLNSVSQSQLDANAVGQGQLKDALQQTSNSATAGNSTYVLFTGGIYTLGWGLANNNFKLHGYFPVSTYYAGIGMNNSAGTTQTYYFQANYFTASKPYNLGHGEIPLFIFAIIDNATRDVTGVYSADDAPWHYNGPTSIKPDFYKNGEGYINTPLIMRELIATGKSLQAEIRGPQRNILLDRLATDPLEPMLITQKIKNADQPLIQHPFIGCDLTGKTVVSINPQNTIIEHLAILREAGEPVNDWFLDGNLIVDNDPIDRGFAVQTHDLKWKLT